MSIQLELPFPPEEEWRDVPDYAGRYQVSNLGRVRSFGRYNRPIYTILTQSVIRWGYLRVTLFQNTVPAQWAVHRLVMHVFVGECPEGMQVNHKNGVKDDNRLENLEYTTPKENIRHSFDVLGRVVVAKGNSRGAGHPHARLNDDKVREIRKLYSEGHNCAEIGRMYGIAKQNINLIVKRKSWKHVE